MAEAFTSEGGGKHNKAGRYICNRKIETTANYPTISQLSCSQCQIFKSDMSLLSSEA